MLPLFLLAWTLFGFGLLIFTMALRRNEIDMMVFGGLFSLVTFPIFFCTTLSFIKEVLTR